MPRTPTRPLPPSHQAAVEALAAIGARGTARSTHAGTSGTRDRRAALASTAAIAQLVSLESNPIRAVGAALATAMWEMGWFELPGGRLGVPFRTRSRRWWCETRVRVGAQRYRRGEQRDNRVRLAHYLPVYRIRS
jgi:hypothetical protein